jgi:hypothetical protein
VVRDYELNLEEVKALKPRTDYRWSGISKVDKVDEVKTVSAPNQWQPPTLWRQERIHAAP